MQHFIYDLNPESEHFLNLAFEGSVLYKTVAEVRTILEKVLNSTRYTNVFHDPPELEVPPTERQPLHILSVVSSPPPPHIQDITEPPKFSDHEPMLDELPMFIPNLFSEEEYIELGHVSNMPKEHKCNCSRSEAFVPEATSQIEGLSMIMSRVWTEEAESCGSIIQSYCNPRLLFFTIGDTCRPQEAFYDLRVKVNVMSRALADHISPEHPLTLSRNLKWIDCQIVECQGIL